MCILPYHSASVDFVLMTDDYLETTTYTLPFATYSTFWEIQLHTNGTARDVKDARAVTDHVRIERRESEERLWEGGGQG